MFQSNKSPKMSDVAKLTVFLGTHFHSVCRGRAEVLLKNVSPHSLTSRDLCLKLGVATCEFQTHSRRQMQ